jgi:transcriptional regulator with XRE-family HTH domain
MSRRNALLAAPPHAVEVALKRLGANLRTARLRRGLTLAQTADKIGTGVRTVAAAERGNPSTGMDVYAGLLWAFDLLEQLEGLADPGADPEGEALALSREPTRARRRKGLDDDF